MYRKFSPHSPMLCLYGIPDHDCVHIFAHTSIFRQVELLFESRREAEPSIQRSTHHRGLEKARQLRSVGLGSTPINQLSPSPTSMMRWIRD
jgi:hypothetical protein